MVIKIEQPKLLRRGNIWQLNALLLLQFGCHLIGTLQDIKVFQTLQEYYKTLKYSQNYHLLPRKNLNWETDLFTAIY